MHKKTVEGFRGWVVILFSHSFIKFKLYFLGGIKMHTEIEVISVFIK